MPGVGIRSRNARHCATHRGARSTFRRRHSSCAFAGAERAAGALGRADGSAFRSSTSCAHCGRMPPSITARRPRAAFAIARRARSRRTFFGMPTTSRPSAKACARKYRNAGYRAERVTVIPNAVDTRDFRFGGTPDAHCARRLGLDGATVVGFAGSFYAYEGLDLLLDAAALLVSRHPNLRVLLVGGGPQEDALKAQADVWAWGSRRVRGTCSARRSAALLPT